MRTSQGFAHILLLVIIILVAVAGIGYVALQNRNPNWNEGPLLIGDLEAEQKDWEAYTNVKYQFSLKYPNQWLLRDPSEEDNALAYFMSDGSIENAKPEPFVFVTTVNELPDLNYNTKVIGENEFLVTEEWVGQFGTLSYFIKSKDEDYISIVFSPYSRDDPYSGQENSLRTFIQILSTFEFTN